MAGVVLTFKVMFGCMMKLIIEVKKKQKIQFKYFYE
jgi:hypothetical protein